MLHQLKEFLRRDVETEKTRQSTRLLICLVSLILTLCSATMSVVNWLDQGWLMLATTSILTVVCLFCFLISLMRYNRNIVECILCVTLISLFSFYVVIGGNAGFAIDWILLIPIAYMTLFGLTPGLLMGGYFWVFLIVFLWSPVNGMLPYVYSNEVRLRFPILYSCCFFLAIVIGIRNKKQQIGQIQHENKLAEAVLTERNRVERISMDAISSICHALDAKDPYTRAHSDHVAAYACLIAQSCGWDEKRIELLSRAARVHDLGKIGIPDAVLKKPGALDAEEIEIMRQHVALGAAITSEFISMPELAVGAKYHHERYDGKGYATGIAGEEIPIEGRIIGLADAIDAISSDRVYRKKHTREFLLEELKSGSGTQFDPQLVTVALRLVSGGMLEQVEAAEHEEKAGRNKPNTQTDGRNAMTILEAMESRHSVRRYLDKKLEAGTLQALREEIEACNTESGLHLQLITEAPEAFGGMMAHYGGFRNVKNYFALVGTKSEELDEKIGYYGERLVLAAQRLGLNTCWVAQTYRKGKSGCAVSPGAKLVCVISVGYGDGHGVPHKSKPLDTLCRVEGQMPEWFRRGMEAALLAPTAVNQQKFLFTLCGGTVKAEATGGFYSKVDLGIVKYHFEVGAGSKNFFL